MKRRNAADFSSKIRRPKKNKIDGICSNSNFFFYLKFLLLWSVVIIADFITELRFEYCWPFWLLLRSVYDSYKYKGLAFSFLFICIAITSDLICLFFIPVQWIFFAASTYVWVQYVWHTDKGVCLPTIILWILFVYVEAKIRWKDNRNMPHLDLCRPFAAHCIGYPVVTLGFGFKSYVGYRIRQRKQRDVAKENEFYMQLLQQALPPKDEISATSSASPNDSSTNINNSSVMQLQKDVNPIATNNTHLHINNNYNNHYNTSNSSSYSNNSKSHNSNSNGHAVGAVGSQNSSASSDTVTSAKSSEVLQLNENVVVVNHKSHKKNADKDNLNNHMEPENCQILNNKKENHKSNHLNYNNLNNSNNLKNNNSGNSSNNHEISTSNNSSNNSSYQINTNYSPFKNNAKDLMEKETIHSQFNTNTSTNKKEYEKNKFNKDSEYSATSGPSSGGASYENTQTTKLKNDANYMENPIKESKGKNNYCYQEIHTPEARETSNESNNSSHSHKKSKHLYQQRPQKDNQQHDKSHESNNSSDYSNIKQNKMCEQCLQLEQDAKRLKSELNSIKNLESEMRSSVELNATLKACLQAKQQDYEEMRNQLQEVVNARHVDQHNYQEVERRLLEERRHRQQLESQLNNEKRMRKQLEEKLSMKSECTDNCKMKKMHIENENNKLRREYKLMEESKHNMEKQNRIYEQELRKHEVEYRNREMAQSAEVLMSALQAMQEKNNTLEKNLSSETRVKLDLFSALGEAKRQLEIKDNLLHQKEVLLEDLEKKTAQLLAVMPNDSISLTNSGCLSSTSPLMCLSTDTSQTAQLLSVDSNKEVLGGGNTNPNVYSSSIVMAGQSITKSPSPGQQTPPPSSSNSQQDSSTSSLDPNARAFNPLINAN